MTERRSLEALKQETPTIRTERVLGRHILLDMLGCSPARLNDIEALKTCLLQAAEVLGATVLNVYGHCFTPQGATVIVAVSESHLAIHTWPEYGYAAVDLFLCGRLDRCVEAAVELLIDCLQPEYYELKPLDRGTLKKPSAGSHQYSASSHSGRGTATGDDSALLCRPAFVPALSGMAES